MKLDFISNKNSNNLKHRLLEFIKYKGLTTQNFEKSVGLSNGAVSKMGDNTRLQTLDKISKTFPDLNVNWLRTGEGEMLRKTEASEKIPEKKSDDIANAVGVYPVMTGDTEVVEIDFIPVSAHATFTESFLDGNNAEQFERVPFIPTNADERKNHKLYKIFEIRGDSMETQISDGDLVLAREVPQSRWHSVEGVAVVVYDECVVLKRITANRIDGENLLELSSDNPVYGSKTVQLADIRAIFEARRVISSKIV